VSVRDVDGVIRGHDPMRTEGQALSSDDLECSRINLYEPARVVGNPDGSVAEGDALRAAENERSADHAIRVRVHLRDRRAALVALVVVAGPDEAGAKRNHGTEIDGTRRDPRGDPSRLWVDADQSPIRSVRRHPHRAGPNCDVPRIDR
jgi:hypothetical protein